LVFVGHPCRFETENRGDGRKYGEQFQIVFEAIRQLLAEEEKPQRKIGF